MKNKYMTRQNICILLTLLLGGVGGGLLSSCTDTWDDHYAVQQRGEGSMWQAISSNSELSNFMAVLKATGYEKALDGSQVFTVFAPTNAQFTAEKRDSVIQLYNAQKAAGLKDKRNAAIVEFVQNHIALYNYSSAEGVSDSIVMMNGKISVLNGNKIDNISLEKENLLTTNGVLFTMKESAAFKPNVFEMIGRDPELSGLRSFFYMGEKADDPYKFYSEYFDPARSVPGEIIDGQTHYLDSVTVIGNTILENSDVTNFEKRLGLLNSEDSTYWMIAPTNELWDSLVTDYSKYYQYDKTVTSRDSLMYTMPRLAIVRGTVFSKTDNPDSAINDSVLSTNNFGYQSRKSMYGSYDKTYYQYAKPYAEGGVFTGTNNVQCSNGILMKTDEWKIKKSETFLREIVMECEDNSSIDTEQYEDYTAIKVNVANDNPYYGKVSGNSYVEIERAGSLLQKVLFNVSDVLSNVAYDVYVVTVPALAGDTLASADAQRKTTFRTQIFYKDANGKEVKTTATSAIETDPTKVDSIKVATITIPTCSYGQSEPSVKLFLESRAGNSAVLPGTGKYTSTIRLDCIVFKPHEEE